MSDEKTAPSKKTVDFDRAQRVDLQVEMQRSCLDYVMSAIVGRALPDVRGGLEPVHRRVLCAMYDGGYRPSLSFSKSSRIVDDVMDSYHPHDDSTIYDTLARLMQWWSLRCPLVAGQGNLGTPGNLGLAAPRYTGYKMAPLAMKMVRSTDRESADFQDNYDGKNQEPTILPSRFPNLLVNDSEGIAVGMATRIPPHNLREVAKGVQWALDNPEASREELLEALLKIIPGPDFPTSVTILGRKGIKDVYRTGRGSIAQRAVVNVEEIHDRRCLIVAEPPYQVNLDNLADKIAQLVCDGQIQRIADIRDETSGRTGQRLVIVLKRDATAKVVLSNLYKRTSLQENLSANMLALVDGVLHTLSIDSFIRHWVTHQMQVIQRHTDFRLRKALERLHILESYLKALDALNEVIALIRRSPTVEEARTGLMELLDVDSVQTDAILVLQLRRLIAPKCQKILNEHAELTAHVTDLHDILERPERQRAIISEEPGEIVAKHGDERRTRIVPLDGEMGMEDPIPEEDAVVTIIRDGFTKRTCTDHYRSQKRGSKGVRGTQLRGDDVVKHFSVTTIHHWLLFFTNPGRVYRAKAYEIPEGSRDARGQHVANLLAFQPEGKVAQVLAIRDYEVVGYLVLAAKSGLIRKTSLKLYESAHTGGIITVNLHEDGAGCPDELVSAQVITSDQDPILMSRDGQAARFTASDENLRPMGRPTSGVHGMKLRGDDELLSMEVLCEDSDLLIVTEPGYAKRTPMEGHPRKGRDTLGVYVGKLVDERDGLVGTLAVNPDEDVMATTESDKLVQVNASDVRSTARNTMGVIFARLDEDDRIIAVTPNPEHDIDEDEDEFSDEVSDGMSGEVSGVTSKELSGGASGELSGEASEESSSEEAATLGESTIEKASEAVASEKESSEEGNEE